VKTLIVVLLVLFTAALNHAGAGHALSAALVSADRQGWVYAFVIVVAALVYVVRALARHERAAVAR
jgi:hypothetical protein